MLVRLAQLAAQDRRAGSANRSSLLAIQLVGVIGDVQHLFGLDDLVVQLLELQLPLLAFAAIELLSALAPPPPIDSAGR